MRVEPIAVGTHAVWARAPGWLQTAGSVDVEVEGEAAAVEEKYWSLWGIKTVRKIHEEHLAILTGLSESVGALLMTGQIELAEQIDFATSAS